MCAAEVQVKSESELKMVDWSVRDTWQGKDVRKPDPAKKELTVCLNEGETVFAFLSEIQLPYQRVLEHDGYAPYPLLASRAEAIEITNETIEKRKAPFPHGPVSSKR